MTAMKKRFRFKSHEELLDKLYKDISKPEGYSSIKKLYDAAKSIDSTVTLKIVKDYLSGENSYTLYYPVRYKYKRRKFFFSRPGLTLLADVAYMMDFSHVNNRYLLFLLDAYSRYLYIYPLKDLKSNTVGSVLRNFLENESLFKYSYLLSDDGIELRNNYIKKIYKEFGITPYSTRNREIKSAISERNIRTIKNRIYKYVSDKVDKNYEKILDKLVDSYNISNHRSLLNNKLVNIHLLVDAREILDFSKKIYKLDRSKKQSFKDRLSEGQLVRLTGVRRCFLRGYKSNVTIEIFKIKSVNNKRIPITYSISDLENNPIEGEFYHQELVKVTDKGLYDVEILETKKSKGKIQHLVKFVNYPTSEPKWMTASQIFKKT